MIAANRADDDGRARLLFIADRYLAVDNLPSARRSLARLLARDPDDVDALCTQARIAIAESDWTGAVDASVRASALAPGNPWPYRLLAIARSGQGRHSAARSAAAAARKAAPGDWQSHFVVATVHLRSGRVSAEAKDSAREALRLAPDEAAVHDLQGDLALAQGFVEDAERAYRRALALDPENPEYRTDLAATKLRNGRAAAAAVACMDVLAADPGSPQALRTLGLVGRYWTNRLLVGSGAILLVIMVIITQTIPPEFETTWIETPSLVMNPSFVVLPIALAALAAGLWWHVARQLRGRAAPFIRALRRSDRAWTATLVALGVVILGTTATAILPYWMGPANLFFALIIVTVAWLARPLASGARLFWALLR
ncbi:tetratricopeptide repeat protein [Cryocola sp. 340MFSha3.1]|uniref:tetratricopeptide repeat protein n=1 Tax=Cryocola sp. 340MFSha3.1 TaxID=1169145 RepID=UPI0003A9E8B6|nr:tetratricopeptide repeat protein [Cryocola sp. 340MFSha3.1]